ncbi:MAG: hypothetical protein ACLSVX_02695 [Massilimicrobiota timonensis]
MIYDIVYDNNGSPIKIQPVKSYRLEELKKGMYVYYEKLQRNFKIINIYSEAKRIYLENYYGAIIYEDDLFYPAQK